MLDNPYIDFSNSDFLIAAGMIIICPITWNLVARFEFYTKYFTKLLGDNKLAADIFAHVLIEMGIFRNYMFTRACKSQSTFDMGKYDIIASIVSYFLMIEGAILVYMSYFRLGIHGVYYGDYFGILMKEKVTAFPYNYLDNPMYIGSTTLFLGMGLYYRSYTGVFLTCLVVLMYQFASFLENPMTELIYSECNIKAVKQMEQEKEITQKKKQADKKD